MKRNENGKKSESYPGMTAKTTENDRKRPKMTEKTGRLVVLRRMNSSIFPQNSIQIPRFSVKIPCFSLKILIFAVVLIY